MDTDEEKLILHERAEVVDDFELIPGGRNITVGGENKHEYVTHELELLISGLADIDCELTTFHLQSVDELRANTECFGYNNASSIIQWFWEVVQGFSEEDSRVRFLQFVSGTSKVSFFI
ncbi:unnamed protein product [Musa hybrid cultivar]